MNPQAKLLRSASDDPKGFKMYHDEAQGEPLV